MGDCEPIIPALENVARKFAVEWVDGNASGFDIVAELEALAGDEYVLAWVAMFDESPAVASRKLGGSSLAGDRLWEFAVGMVWHVLCFGIGE